jgi:hypothetical protein
MNEEDIAALSRQFRGNQWWSKRGGAGEVAKGSFSWTEIAL